MDKCYFFSENKVVRTIKRFFWRVNHLFRWLPIIWNDYDWDHVYLFIIMHHKIKMMKEHHQEHRIISDWEKIAKEMQIAETCLDRLIKDDYSTKEGIGLRKAFEQEELLRKQDLETFATIFKKHVRSWWD